VPFTYAAGTMDAWQQFNITGVNTGGQVGSWFDPAVAYGRLDALVTSGGTLQSEVTPIFTKAFTTAGGAFGRVLLSDPTLDTFVKVTATAPTTNPTVTLTFDKRASMVDLGAIASASSATRIAEPLTVAAPVRYYLFRAPIGTTVTTTVTPVQGTLNTNLTRRHADESALGAAINNGAVGAADLGLGVVGKGQDQFEATAADVAGGVGGHRAVDHLQRAGEVGQADAAGGRSWWSSRGCRRRRPSGSP